MICIKHLLRILFFHSLDSESATKRPLNKDLNFQANAFFWNDSASHGVMSISSFTAA